MERLQPTREYQYNIIKNRDNQIAGKCWFIKPLKQRVMYQVSNLVDGVQEDSHNCRGAMPWEQARRCHVLKRPLMRVPVLHVSTYHIYVRGRRTNLNFFKENVPLKSSMRRTLKSFSITHVNAFVLKHSNATSISPIRKFQFLPGLTVESQALPTVKCITRFLG